MFIPGIPPKSVPGPYQEPVTPIHFARPTKLPEWRVLTVPVVSTLADLALRFYKSPSEAMRIFNDNRDGLRMPDGSMGALLSPNDTIMPGTRIWLS